MILYSDKKLGEILISMGFATNEQVFNGLIEAKKDFTKIGSKLVEQGVITIDQLKIALKAQLEIDIVTNEQIAAVDAKTISILPDDFILMYKVMPIRMENGVLIVGMVNPKDQAAISNTIAFTGLNPKILLITHYEFKMLKKMFINI